MSTIEREVDREIIYDHYTRPRHFGALGPDAVMLENPSCGDTVRLSIRGGISSDGSEPLEFRFEGKGCSISQSSTSMMVELLSGKSRGEAIRIAERVLSVFRGERDPHVLEDLGDISALAGIARLPVRVKCAALAWQGALKLLRQQERAYSEVDR
ncbi:Fe-S cluster assembly sulfur transfer protein SufU [Sediminispirochaeta smaragdinae]|jgi:nitrogen fixation NifU-like protein|uniref:SUF system FeS assembly protein, NifU family n=1 Tax=Sediminispirochaeta smaragdinae (strain DSM 11293 / JCM 15392 / SEBR 4228) TaxID=573413 RepID=E1R6U3_SEDSS|nr:SUF system NifU family Fe-S cluster assembly protein [Sediminispirochaeta smaragdinae]ADK79225.1 SUF system FeS assembly protein, NifU family [Sediminispirochaeta smaragdinae DSM 11293]